MLTTSEKIIEIQKGIGAYPDGKMGEQTYDLLYRKFATPELPYRVKLFGQWTFFADPAKVNPFLPRGGRVRDYNDSISGSFSYNGNPISILVSNGYAFREYSCHCWEKKDGKTHFPESVLWYNKNGTYGLSQVTSHNHLPDRANIVWAIGGAGLKEGDAEKEYFTGIFSDVWRRTSHMVIGFDPDGYFTAIECQNMNGTEIKELVNKLNLTHAVMLDGGHVTASNVDGYRYNSYQSQYYAIQLR